MPIASVRWVLALSLITLLPLPFYPPPLRLSVALALAAAIDGYYSVSLALQSLCWAMVLIAVAWGYGRLAINWPAKIRGALVGLLLLAMLIGFTGVGVYYPPGAEAPQSLRQLLQ